MLDDYLFDPQLNDAEYKRDLVAAAAFDRDHGPLFIFKRLTDEYRSVVHVFRVEARGADAGTGAALAGETDSNK